MRHWRGDGRGSWGYHNSEGRPVGVVRGCGGGRDGEGGPARLRGEGYVARLRRCRVRRFAARGVDVDAGECCEEGLARAAWDCLPEVVQCAVVRRQLAHRQIYPVIHTVIHPAVYPALHLAGRSPPSSLPSSPPRLPPSDSPIMPLLQSAKPRTCDYTGCRRVERYVTKDARRRVRKDAIPT